MDSFVLTEIISSFVNDFDTAFVPIVYSFMMSYVLPPIPLWIRFRKIPLCNTESKAFWKSMMQPNIFLVMSAECVFV